MSHIFAAIYNFIQTNLLFTSNVFNFLLVLIFFIWLLFFKIDVVGLLEKKSKETAKSIETAEKKKAEASSFLEETKSSLKNLDNEVKNIVDEAQALSTSIENQSEEKLCVDIENIHKRTEVLKEAQISKAQEEVSVVIANAAVAISKEYIKNSLDEAAHKELIMNFIEDLDEGMKL